MSIDEAIEHAKSVSEDASVCQKCRNEHAQLAEWLEELKVLKEQTQLDRHVKLKQV